MTFEFFSSTLKPEYQTPILIKYKKGRKSSWNGKIGTFLTQGYFTRNYSNDANHWMDYTDRLLVSENSTTSKNEIIEWAYIKN